MKSQNDAVNIKNDIEPVQEQQKSFQIAKFRDALKEGPQIYNKYLSQPI